MPSGLHTEDPICLMYIELCMVDLCSAVDVMNIQFCSLPAKLLYRHWKGRLKCNVNAVSVITCIAIAFASL